MEELYSIMRELLEVEYNQKSLLHNKAVGKKLRYGTERRGTVDC